MEKIQRLQFLSKLLGNLIKCCPQHAIQLMNFWGTFDGGCGCWIFFRGAIPPFEHNLHMHIVTQICIFCIFAKNYTCKIYTIEFLIKNWSYNMSHSYMVCTFPFLHCNYLSMNWVFICGPCRTECYVFYVEFVINIYSILLSMAICICASN